MVAIYVEGGGTKNKALSPNCREGFTKFFARAGLTNSLRVVSSGSRQSAYEKFVRHLDHLPDSEFAILLVDSEGPVTHEGPVTDANTWGHVLQQEASWSRPIGAEGDQLHLMVQMMEAWFFADKPALREYYGQNFQVAALRTNPNVGQIRKEDLLVRLRRATRQCGKGEYSKGKHSFALLAKLDPEKLKAACPHAARLLHVLKQHCS